MVLEIELKARIDDFEALRTRLADLGDLVRTYRKEDVYYGHAGAPLFRLRRDGDQGMVTVKDKSILGGIEESREIEFQVDSPEEFGRFAAALGYVDVVRKVKTGSRFRLDGITVELSHVEGLGSYVELELMLPENSAPPEVSDARNRLLRLLSKLEVPEDRLEPRPYTDMLLYRAQP